MAKGKFHEWLKPEGLTLLEGWARDGLTDEQISGNMGVKRQTLYDWKNRFPDISDALKKGKEVIDRQVENALLKRALGYQYDEVTREASREIDEETGEYVHKMIETKRVTKEVQGDTTAQIFWLKNRKPEQWRDKQDVQHSGSVDVNNPYKDLTTDELRKLIRDG
ncbi:helix-turn-helix domain-containing protein [Paenibacillus albidus]|uniref:DNA-packaging protein n=1 Tax=Paenibacillus albidus TaxID=2041023 RepID=UPI001BEA1339|nr:DNA-packaging protein [Paenibacillus albidus]MBT2287988.1 helix-turn-helix domain-containing protein [Paenibacillus albidus]